MRNSLWLLLVCTSLAFAEPQYLDQGWDADEREEFYYTAQGSHLIPYKWFLHLEQTDNDLPFRSDENIRSYGFLPATPSPRNPDGLPVGFVRDGEDPAAEKLENFTAQQRTVIRESTKFEVKQAALGPQFDEELYPQEAKAWFGLTCAACHTHEIEYGGNTIRIDGGSSQADIESFLRDLGLALEATHSNTAKLKRFAAKLKRDQTDLDRFKAEVKQIADAVNRMVKRDTAEHPYGFARLDAFGAILNAVCETALGIPENHREANAPVSYPSLWNTPRMGYVQWGATIAFAEARNVGEVLGVFGSFDIQPGPKQFASTVRLGNLVDIEHRMLKDNLRSPDWPEAFLGPIDDDKAARGQQLFEKNCQSCHPVRNAAGEFELNSAGRIPIRSNTLEEVKTDPQFLKNLALQADTGIFAGALGAETQRPNILRAAVGGILKQRATVEQINLAELIPKPQDPPHPNGAGTGYISRQLEGVWATPPYFHNGSVPNLYETLLPAAERSKTFWVGSRNFDPVKVGFTTVKSELGSQFRVNDDTGEPIVGNANVGHEGHGKTENEGFTQTFENGVWRDFTEDERYALVEYMKSLSSATPFEQIPKGEAKRIDHIVDAMTKLMRRRYPQGKRMLRGVHPKGHGCVKAEFEVLRELPDSYDVGVFQPGTKYNAYIRFSNAAGLVGADSKKDQESGKAIHGSRGMAIKLLGVNGQPLVPLHGALTQDFVMINQPAFAFANVEDYELLNQVLLRDNEKPNGFFAERLRPDSTAGEKARAQRTAAIAGRIRASDKSSGAFFEPPASPVDNPYFSAAPFRLGADRVMKFRAKPVARSNDQPNIEDPDYLENALAERLSKEDILFDFEIQVRSKGNVNITTDIENASTEWEDAYVKVARIRIPQQEVDSPELRVECERLFFTPWHGIKAHEPLGGINRLRKAVYEASAQLRSLPKEEAGKQ